MKQQSSHRSSACVGLNTAPFDAVVCRQAEIAQLSYVKNNERTVKEQRIVKQLLPSLSAKKIGVVLNIQFNSSW
jgi:hypothetical protein